MTFKIPPNLPGTFVGNSTPITTATTTLKRLCQMGITCQPVDPVGRYCTSWDDRRAAHIHFKLNAPGYAPLTTQIFIDGDPHLESDTTFAVRSAIIQLQKHDSPDALKARQQSQPFYTAEFDFVLKPLETATVNDIKYATTVA